jgi:hypothetical protein
MNRWIGRILLVGAIFVGTALVSVAPAQAAPQTMELTNAVTGEVVTVNLVYTDCAAGTGCLWDNQNGMGNILTIAFSVHGYSCWNLARPQAPLMSNNDMESGRVGYGSGQDLRVFDLAGCSTSGFECQLFNGFNYTYGPLNDCSNMASSFRIANL